MPLDQLDDQVHLRLPLVQLAGHYLEVGLAQVAREDPVDVDHLLDLVDVPADQLQREGFHEEELNVALVQLAVLGDAVELKRAVVLVHFEEQLQEGDDADFLLQRT